MEMSKNKPSLIITFKPVYDPDHGTEADEVVMRIKDISLIYVRNGSCYLQAENWDTPYQLPVREYDRIKRSFEEQS